MRRITYKNYGTREYEDWLREFPPAQRELIRRVHRSEAIREKLDRRLDRLRVLEAGGGSSNSRAPRG